MCKIEKVFDRFLLSLLRIGMRFLLYVQIPTEAGNSVVQDPNFLQKIEDYINNVKAEAAYFGPSNGNRTMFFIVNMDTPDKIPIILEPLFQEFKAKVEVYPLMILDDLKKAFSKLG